MDSVLSIEQQNTIVVAFNHILLCIQVLSLNNATLSLLDMLKHISSPSPKSAEYFLTSFLRYLILIYINSEVFITKLLIPFLRYAHSLLVVWTTYKVTTFYHVHYPLLKFDVDECERESNEARDFLQNTSDHEDSTSQIGISPVEVEDELGGIYDEEDPPIIANM